MEVVGTGIEKGQTFFAIKGYGFMPADNVIEVVKVEAERVIRPQSVRGVGSVRGPRLYRIGENAFLDRSSAYERALVVQGYRVALATDKRRKHMQGWDALLLEIPHELPDGWVRENFNAAEFKCKQDDYDYTPKFKDLENCQGEEERMDRHLVERLQLSRKEAGVPYNINSGWRCEYWNAVVGGSKDSSHLKGLAADIEAVTSEQRYTILAALIQAGFKRIGIGKDFIHVDVDPEKEQGIIWLY